VTAHHRRFLWLEQGLGSVFVNFPLNAAIAWLAFRGTALVPFWGSQSIAGDTIGTCFVLPIVTALVATPLCRRAVRTGAVPPLPWNDRLRASLGRLPSGTFARGVVLGLVTTALVAPPALAALLLLGVESMPFGRFVAFKAAFAAALGVPVTPAVAAYAIARDRD
jgi:hypothetical protein